MRARLAGCAFLLAWCATQASSQMITFGNPSKPKNPNAPRGMVSGTVYCADTNEPARLAMVMLVRAGGKEADGPVPPLARTDLDGRFVMARVPEGKYYVTAALSGYLNDAWLIKQLASKKSEEDRKAAEAKLTSVTISASAPAGVSLRLERAAEISGTVLYDDGSPAVGLQVTADRRTVSAEDKSKRGDPQNAMLDFMERGQPATDDRGRFRLLGVAPGEYVVSVRVPALSMDRAPQSGLEQMLQAFMSELRVYTGGTLQPSKAAVTKVAGGEDVGGTDITIPLGRLHTIRGTVLLKRTGEAAPAAELELLFADTREVVRKVRATNGTFEIPYAPEGTFILVGTNSAQISAIGGDDDELSNFSAVSVEMLSQGDTETKAGASAELPLVVKGDVSGVIMMLPDETPPKKQGAAGAADAPVIVSK